MKPIVPIVCILCFACSHLLFAAGGEPQEGSLDPVAALERKMDQQQKDLLRRLGEAEARLAEMSTRLGESFGRTTVFNTVEKRLTNVEKKMDELDRALKRIEMRLTTLERKR